MTLLEILNELGYTPYTFPEDIDKRIEETCRIEHYTVFEVPERGCLKIIPFEKILTLRDFAETSKTISALNQMNCCYSVINPHYNQKAITVRSSDLKDYSKEEIEFALWHEIGHLISDDHDNEEIADNHAIRKLTERYGDITAEYIYLHWLFKQYEVDRTSGKYDFDSIRDKRIRTS